MGQIIAIVNQKGGVGKTTTAVNLTAALTEQGKKVLLCDFDPQANASSGLGIDRKKKAKSIYDVIINGVSPSEVWVKTKFGWVLPASNALAGAAVELIGLDDREHILKKALEPLREQFDMILIDCPLPWSADHQRSVRRRWHSDPRAVRILRAGGPQRSDEYIAGHQAPGKPTLSIYGVLLTMYDGRTNFSAQVAQEVRRHFPGKVFQNAIPRNVRLAEAPSHGLPVCAYDRSSRGAISYAALAEEIIRKG